MPDLIVRRLAVVTLALLACSSHEAATVTPTGPVEPARDAAALPDPAPPEPGPTAEPDPNPPARGHDFIDEASALYRVATCGTGVRLPDNFDPRIVAKHCKKLRHRIDRYRNGWIARAMPFLARLRPADLPDRVVYPFGGGDLSTALATFPDAVEITTISLEAAGDPRPIDDLHGEALDEDLAVVSSKIERLFQAAHSTTKSLQAASHSALPGTLMFALVGLVVHDYEPVSLRYFVITPSGDLDYLDDATIAAAENGFPSLEKDMKVREARKKKLQVWRQQVAVFANMELGFRKRGQPDAPVKIYRHIVANLDNQHLADTPELLTHLERKGQVAAMTKAASYLLWMDEFSTIRDYLLGHMTWMISDSSGIPPRYARAAGFEQIPYGDYAGPYFYYRGRTSHDIGKQFLELWESSPKRKLPFRYGYPDVTKKGKHLMVTRRHGER